MSIESSLQELKKAKEDIKNIIISKGGTVTEDMGFGSFADKLLSVSNGIAPPVGFVPSAWDSDGYYTTGTWYGANIPNGAFSVSTVGYNKLDSIEFHDELVSIGHYSFENCGRLSLTALPDTIVSIGNLGFYHCPLLLTSLPSSITSIGTKAFYFCNGMKLTSFPKGITTIGGQAFAFCTGLTSITFEGTPTSIDSTSFRYCTTLTTINVPWAEGEVANAPWGATNATINYNYTGV